MRFSKFYLNLCLLLFKLFVERGLSTKQDSAKRACCFDEEAPQTVPRFATRECLSLCLRGSMLLSTLSVDMQGFNKAVGMISPGRPRPSRWGAAFH